MEIVAGVLLSSLMRSEIKKNDDLMISGYFYLFIFLEKHLNSKYAILILIKQGFFIHNFDFKRECLLTRPSSSCTISLTSSAQPHDRVTPYDPYYIITLQPSWNHFRNLCLWISNLSFNSHILSTAIARSDQSNCILAHWKHNQSDVNDAVHVRIVQFYFVHNF